MNKIRNSFTLIVALATIGITLMSNKAVTEKNNHRESFRCFKGPVTVKLFCAGPSQVLSSSTTCEDAQTSEFYKAHVFNLDPNNYIEDADIPQECGGGDVFCCVQVLPDVNWSGGNFEGPCSGQPYFDLEGTYAQYEVWQVHCKYN
ncbi:hypothetical protein [Pedobacter heparinus]|uniref:Secreted protein n=1 Tax=Pedobacter heparinus (strain ATCC 13125 / DSM 2366 / CIP 104194 / JCM 7457 / NBRC 12017 / NCIMB 9290 / NRRL B-14731 / HIM 762-3) TaxID=485917 RepID=C6Y2S0_PEDHD|nr:hypothetical protein [Pedobacter heparinus]ACU03133.1 hypothetical protein Phep_0911 [Pedobacter heparinus DSM 2366]